MGFSWGAWEGFFALCIPAIPWAARGIWDGYMRSSASGHMKKRTIANKKPCSHRTASGALSMDPLAKGKLLSVFFGGKEGLQSIQNSLSGLSQSGTPAEWAPEMTPYMPYNPTQASYTPPNDLAPRIAYIRIWLW